MRKIILNLAVSLDGYIEGPNGEYDWCLNDQDYGLTDFYNATDAIFIGRKSYELISNDPSDFADKQIYVFSDTLSTDQPANVEVIPKQNYIDRIHEIRNEPGLNIWLFGGAGLVSGFMANNLVNELILSVHPILLGSGKPLFQDVKDRINLNLTHQEVFSSGLVQLTYVPQPLFDYSILDAIKF